MTTIQLWSDLSEIQSESINGGYVRFGSTTITKTKTVTITKTGTQTNILALAVIDGGGVGQTNNMTF
jgi:hypothetical protein